MGGVGRGGGRGGGGREGGRGGGEPSGGGREANVGSRGYGDSCRGMGVVVGVLRGREGGGGRHRR
jgi:hypothetical protein